MTLGLGLRVYQLAQPGFLLGATGYDDGVYFGNAVRMVHGALPYRDFVAVHPPGITLLMAPIAEMSKAIGTANGLAVARALTACVGVISIALMGRLVRHCGVPATVAACGLLAVFPDGVSATHTLMLEPWLILFCLIGMVAAFDGDALTRGKSIWWAGAAFGFAGAIKVWAIIPVAVMMVLCLTRHRAAAKFGIGVAAGFFIPVLPFSIAAPKSFFDSVVIAQIGRVYDARTPTWQRLVSMTGLTYADVGPTIVLAISVTLATLVIAFYACAAITTRNSPSVLRWFALVTTAGIAAAFLWPPSFYYHYTAFLVPFLALTLALPMAGLSTSGWGQCARYSGTGLALVLIGLLTASQVCSKNITDPYTSLAADLAVPPGACVLTDITSLTIAANRFVSTASDCPLIVDGIGTDYTLSHGRSGITGAAEVPAVRQLWATAFEHAQYVWLSEHHPRRIAWTPSLTTYFRTHFQLVRLPGVPPGLYARTVEPPG